MEHYQTVLAHVRRRGRRFWLKLAVMILVGIPLSLLIAVVAASLVAPLTALGGLYFAPLRTMGWYWLFYLFVLALVPILYVTELSLGGEQLCKILRSADSYGPKGTVLTAGPLADLDSLEVARPTIRAPSPLVALFLGGPRLVLGAAHKMEVAWRLRRVDAKKAAEVLAILLSEQQGVDTTSRLCAEDELDDLIPTLAYLAFHRWIGMRDRWQHLWLFSESRELLSPE